MDHIDNASEPLKLIMRRVEAVHWEKQMGGSILIYAYPKGNKGNHVAYKVTPEMLHIAEEFLETRVWPLRGQLDAIPMEPRSRRKRGPERKRMPKRL